MNRAGSPTQLALALALSACEPAHLFDERRQAALAGAAEDLTHRGVVALARDPSAPFCSGVSLGGRVVVTASHCVDDAVAADLWVLVGRGGGQIERMVRVRRIVVHPGWNRETGANDLALLVLADALDQPPWNLPAASGANLTTGMSLLAVGFGPDGKTDPRPLRRAAVATLAGARAGELLVSVERGGFCPGDSGGPVFLPAASDGGSVLVGVLSRGSSECEGPAIFSSIAPHLAFVSAGQAWAADGSRQLGERCLDGQHCASSICALALDDWGLQLCSRLCQDASDCPEPMLCDTTPGRAPHCRFPLPTPGALEASCTRDADCRTGRCRGAVCRTRCFGNGDCSHESTCEADAPPSTESSCRSPRTVYGGCRVGGASAPRGDGPGVLVAQVAALAILTLGAFRRRRRCSLNPPRGGARP